MTDNSDQPEVKYSVKELIVALEGRVRKLETKVAAMYVIIPIATAVVTALIIRGMR